MIIICVVNWNGNEDVCIKCLVGLKSLNWLFNFKNIMEDILVFSFIWNDGI